MGLWWEVARRSFQRAAAYPAAVAAGLFTNSVFGCVRAWVLLAVFAGGARLGGFDATDAVTFAFLTQGLIMATGGLNLGELPQRIRTGDIALDLHRPVDLQGWWLAVDLGRAGFHLLARGVVPVLVGAVVFRLRWPSGVGLVAFPVSVFLAVVVSFGLRYLMSLACFWLLDEAVSLDRAGVDWSWDRVVLLPVTVLCGTLIFVAVWVAGAALSFATVDGREVVNAFTYGGGFLAQYPLSIYAEWFRHFFTYLLPIAFVSWFPALYLLDVRDPLGLPSWFRFASPVAAAASLAVAAVAWRAAIRHYRSTGS